MGAKLTIVVVGAEVETSDGGTSYKTADSAEGKLSEAIQKLEADGHKIISVAPLTSGQSFNQVAWTYGLSFTDRFLIHSEY